MTAIRRARPLLGTLVEISAEGLHDSAERVVDSAFGEIAEVHRLMSFHQAGSDLDRLHRARCGTALLIDVRTREVFDWVLRIADASLGRFDPTIAAQQVARGLLPPPASPWVPDPAASWRDIELCGTRGVRLARPLWIDLGGIAKGYAVDRAVMVLLDAGATEVCVNAGGDLRVAGARGERVHLRTHAGIAPRPVVELGDAALATSAGTNSHRCGGACAAPVHLHGCTRRAIGQGRVASVVAPQCVVADALTKVVMSGADDVVRRVLARFGAQACVHAPGRGWTLLGAAA